MHTHVIIECEQGHGLTTSEMVQGRPKAIWRTETYGLSEIVGSSWAESGRRLFPHCYCPGNGEVFGRVTLRGTTCSGALSSTSSLIAASSGTASIAYWRFHHPLHFIGRGPTCVMKAEEQLRLVSKTTAAMAPQPTDLIAVPGPGLRAQALVCD